MDLTPSPDADLGSHPFSKKELIPALNPPVRVLILAGGGLSHVSGGVGTLVQYLLDSWAGRDDAPVVQVIDTRGAGGRFGGAWCFAAAFWVLTVQCARKRVDLVHVHMTTRGSVVRKCLFCVWAGLLGVPVVVHMHGADFFDFFARLPRFWQRAVGRVLRGAACVIVLGRAWRDRLALACAVDPARIRIVINGVKAPEVLVPKAEGAAVHILFLGRIGARKGVPELLEALSQLSREGWHATIAGDGEAGGFCAQAERLGLQDRVAWPGWASRAQADALLEAADILVLPSHHEALPMAVLEALARAIPVVVTPVGAIAEFLTDDVDALLVPPGAPAPLAAALARLIGDAAARARIGQAGRVVFDRHLDIGVTAEGVLAIYREASQAA